MPYIEPVYSFNVSVVLLLDFLSCIQRSFQGLPLMLFSKTSSDSVFGFLPAIGTSEDRGFGMDYSNCLIA